MGWIFIGKKQVISGSIILLILLILSGCTEQTATKKQTDILSSDNIIPKIQECRSEYFDKSNTATVYFVGVATDDDGTVVLYSWNLSDGYMTNEQSFVHTFSHPGAYQASLIVMDDKGGINSASITVYVYESPYETEQRDTSRMIGRWENREGTVIEFTKSGDYISPRYQIHDSYWFANGDLFIHSTTENYTWRYDYSFTDEDTLTFSLSGTPLTSRDTWVRVH